MLSLTTSHETGTRDLPLKRTQSMCRSWVWRSQQRQRARKINLRNSTAPCLLPDINRYYHRSTDIILLSWANIKISNNVTFESVISANERHVFPNPGIWPCVSHITNHTVLSVVKQEKIFTKKQRKRKNWLFSWFQTTKKWRFTWPHNLRECKVAKFQAKAERNALQRLAEFYDSNLNSNLFLLRKYARKINCLHQIWSGDNH